MMQNQAMLAWPNGTTIAAASKGPNAEPALPPTWKGDCASPKRPPEAMRAMREASGWKVDEPTPISAAANRNQPKLPAIANITTPISVKTAPHGSNSGLGCLSVYMPIHGCISDAVTGNVRVISTTCVNVNP